MVKVGSSDVLGILRKFDVADESNVPRHVEQLIVSHPGALNTLVSFRFQKRQYFVLYDDTAEDDLEYITDQIELIQGGVTGQVVANPNDATMTYGFPFKGKDVYLFAVASTKQRLDNWLTLKHPETSRSTWQKYIKAGFVTINGTACESPKQDISTKDKIEFSLPDAPDYSDSTIPILYEDDNVIVVDKPAGMLTHSKGALNDEFTIADFFRRYTTYQQDSNRPGVIHRLDRDTSGVILGVKNPETASLLQKQFSNRTVKKTYVAIVKGHPKEPTAHIDVPIGRNPSAPSTFRADAKGKPAQTNYAVLQSNDRESLVELRPTTGRTHQLRVHMAYIGTPIAGDKVYGKADERMYLHAHMLEVTLPGGDRRVFTSSVPDSFNNRMA